MRTGFGLGVVVLAAAVSSVAWGSVTEYRTKLHRPVAAGTEREVSEEAEETTFQKLALPDHNREENRKVTIAVTYREKVLAVNATGQVTKASYTIHTFEAAINAQKVDPLKEGTVVTAQAGQKDTDFRLAEGSLSAPQKEALSKVIQLARREIPTDDEVFHTPEAMQIGTTLDIDKDKVAQALPPELKVDPQKVQGKGILTKALRVQDVACVQFRTELEFPAPLPIPGPGVKALENTVRASGLRTIPVDASLPELESEDQYEIRIKLEFPSPQGQGTLEIRNAMKHTAHTKLK